jgi:hypothetical protein
MGWPGRAQRFICWTVVGRRKAQAEFVAAQRLNADRPEGRATLGNFLARRGHNSMHSPYARARLNRNLELSRRINIFVTDDEQKITTLHEVSWMRPRVTPTPPR